MGNARLKVKRMMKVMQIDSMHQGKEGFLGGTRYEQCVTLIARWME